MSRVVFEHLTKRFGQVVAVDDFTLEVEDQEFLVLLGPSGCGKTTALRVVAGLEDPTSGRILIGERVMNDIPAKRRDVAMVFQNYALYPHMSVYDNMVFGLRLRGIPRRERDTMVRETAYTLGLEDLLRRKPAELSGGQRQRVALGRAIVRRPSVFLMDEPLSNLDAKLRVQTRSELIKLHRRLQGTFIYVTHDQVEAMTMGDRVAVLNEGRLQQLGSPEQIYTRPANTFVAGFIGSPPMNFLPCRYGEEGGRQLLDLEQFNLELPTELAGRLKEKPIPDQLILGLRPKHVLVHREPVPGAVPAEIQLLQPLGSEVIATLGVGEKSFTAEAFSGWLVDEGFRDAAGGKVWITFDRRRLHLFDAKSGETVL